MEKDSKKFPAAMTIKDVLGIESGTVLRFDWASGKYVSVEGAEDIAEDDYYYSGYAIAIDPYVVKDNIGTYFTYIEQNEEQVPEIEQEPIVLEIGKSVEVSEGKVESSYPLVVDCICGHRQLAKIVDTPGINFTLMAEDDESFLELFCSECGSRLRMWFAPSDNQKKEGVTNERTEEESN